MNLDLLEAMLSAVARRQEVSDRVFEAESAEAAESAIRDLLGVDAVAAKAVLNLQLRRLAREDRSRMESDCDRLRQLLAN
ncbi:hypothetical protein [Intrasporangium calvum]|uniref:hypothetical protein n=1 Tax=Intrasporangium calvum TaxID=53358 RepID=UPI000DF620F7|nr:hypothetical protein [Intrasporangium calvum]AXG12618.1 hypothetical protein DN585_03530 [Intrasporangium calvum]